MCSSVTVKLVIGPAKVYNYFLGLFIPAPPHQTILINRIKKKSSDFALVSTLVIHRGWKEHKNNSLKPFRDVDSEKQ